MDKFELAALRSLGTREIWSADELPEGVNIGILRGLDQAGMIEARWVYWVNVQEHFGAPSKRVPQQDIWHSPIAYQTRAGGWTPLLSAHVRSENPPSEIRLTESGLAELAREERNGGSTRPVRRKKRSADASTKLVHANYVRKVMVRRRAYRGTLEELAAEAGYKDCNPSALYRINGFRNWWKIINPQKIAEEDSSR